MHFRNHNCIPGPWAGERCEPVKVRGPAMRGLHSAVQEGRAKRFSFTFCPSACEAPGPRGNSRPSGARRASVLRVETRRPVSRPRHVGIDAGRSDPTPACRVPAGGRSSRSAAHGQKLGECAERQRAGGCRCRARPRLTSGRPPGAAAPASRPPARARCPGPGTSGAPAALRGAPPRTASGAGSAQRGGRVEGGRAPAGAAGGVG